MTIRQLYASGNNSPPFFSQRAKCVRRSRWHEAPSLKNQPCLHCIDACSKIYKYFEILVELYSSINRLSYRVQWCSFTLLNNVVLRSLSLPGICNKTHVNGAAQPDTAAYLVYTKQSDIWMFLYFIQYSAHVSVVTCLFYSLPTNECELETSLSGSTTHAPVLSQKIHK